MSVDGNKIRLIPAAADAALQGLQPRYKSILTWVALAFALYLALLVIGDEQDIQRAFSGLRVSTVLSMLGLALVNYALRFARWHLYIQRLGYRLPAHWDACCYIAGFAFTATPGKVGELLRAVFLKRFGVRYGHTISACVAERLLDLVAVAAIATLALYELGEYRWLLLCVALALMGSVWLVGRPRVLMSVFAYAATFFRGQLKSLFRRMEDTVGAISQLMTGWPLVWGLLIGLCGWLAEATAFTLVAGALGASLPWWHCVAIYAAGLLVGALSFLPGGLVGTELVLTALLMAAGASGETAIAATLVSRLTTLWFSVGLGVLAVTWVELRRPATKHALAE